MEYKIWTTIFLLFFSFFTLTESSFSENEVKIIMSQGNMKEKQTGKLDINVANKGEFLAAGIASRYTDGILEYRTLVGSFKTLEEIKNIKGIGEATYHKLAKKLEVATKKSRNPLYINRADSKLLKYYGFSKKEIKEIEKYRDKIGRIENNIILRKIIGKKQYEKYKDLFRYSK
ncbi:ComEA family DNA-binding protein [Fusobacterium necrophorum]|uniref:ComEA family DNA-binding protein n=1 Tax=Fusobacterium necrophorum TaxID=859 RepID=A0A4Q2L4J4_9FUSO|nr:helix-hairpin-helix domain-containing protein [Fusobacterium necrophorum]RXZ71061.1 ComEA family DNA-binding protein [Fusobacterium necrophorum]